MPELPPPLPPGERTVGQLIAETIRAYGANFWRALPLGVVYAGIDQACVHESWLHQLVVYYVAAPFMAAAYVYACSLLLKRRATRTAYVVALLVYVPFPLLRGLFLLPGIAWFALFGLAVPATLVEGLPLRRAIARGRALAANDYVHALGSLASLVVVVGIGDQALTQILRAQSRNSQRAALLLADFVLTPLFYLGGAMLYTDQAARLRSRRARVHPPLDADATGHPDPQVEP
ncbi:MAG: hypothetical protein JO186_06535 [Actinobacteria bacterium]|nr:hypothetical protein [Actinomycetota bacterium]MBV8395951.1 hypothetical protein [Actinomycetota bacterium]MBV8597709.1 hypothetical protein [Actinomycetota bacterium]